ncbi:3'-5' exonuclease, partial [Klebsiella pneumoniae]|uniref:3'-5' exonuclease n=1 Tax=Klebsiella pneumoniae TaxID=573 RepID=UPI0025A15B35
SINNEYYLSDFKEFLRESNLEDFVDYNKNKIVVSTIHKAKGKEFDSVFVMIKNGERFSIEDKRKLYVAFTRAKNNLYI